MSLALAAMLGPRGVQKKFCISFEFGDFCIFELFLNFDHIFLNFQLYCGPETSILQEPFTRTTLVAIQLALKGRTNVAAMLVAIATV